MNYKEFNYRGYDVEIYYDEYPMNPMEDWNGLYPLYTKGNGYEKDYSDGQIHSFLVNYLSDNQISFHMKKILKFIGQSLDDFNYYNPYSDFTKGSARSGRADVLRDEISELIRDDFDMMGEFCDMFGIKYINMTSSGYSQGDWANVFICWTPDFEKTTGVKYKDVTEEDMMSTFDAYSAWAWGDVFGYSWEHGGCAGYYGEKEMEYIESEAKNEIDCHIKYENEKSIKEHSALLKAMIKAHAPLYARRKLQLIKT